MLYTVYYILYKSKKKKRGLGEMENNKKNNKFTDKLYFNNKLGTSLINWY